MRMASWQTKCKAHMISQMISHTSCEAAAAACEFLACIRARPTAIGTRLKIPGNTRAKHGRPNPLTKRKHTPARGCHTVAQPAPACARASPNIGLGWQQRTHSSLKHGLASFLGHAAWSISRLTERCSAACRGAAAARGSNQVETLGAPSGQGHAATDGHNHTATRAAPQPWLPTHGKHVQSAGALGVPAGGFWPVGQQLAHTPPWQPMAQVGPACCCRTHTAPTTFSPDRNIDTPLLNTPQK